MARINIYPFLLKHRADSKGMAQVLIRVDMGGQPIYYDTVTVTKTKIHVTNWDAKNRTVKGNKLLAELIALRVEVLKEKLLIFEKDSVELTKDRVKLILEGKYNSTSFISGCKEIVLQKYPNPNTAKNFTTTINHIENFKPGLSFADIDYKFLVKFKKHLRDTQKLQPNSIWRILKDLHSLWKEAKKQKFATHNPFEDFDRGAYKNPDKDFLTTEEVEAIAELLPKPLPPHLYNPIRYFLLSCYCGLRYEDLVCFDRKLHTIENERLVMITQKAKVLVNIKQYPKLKNIIESIEEPLNLSNQKFNGHLKTIAQLAGISKSITAHTGRHTFGRKLAGSMRIELAQKLLGHKDIGSTKIYYHLEDKELDDAIDENFG